MRRTGLGRLAAGRLWLMLFVSLGACFLATSVAAAAGPPFQATGSFTQTSFTVTASRTVDGITFFEFTETDSLTGTFVGTSVIQGSCAQLSSGEILCQATETFTGALAGQSGTAVFHDVVSIDSTTGSIAGRFAVVSGTGDLANLHGQGTFEGLGTTGIYTGLLVFGP